jgi:undecaprenyl pyrophosphate phosphatase UppP
MSFKKRMASSDIIDEDYSNKEYLAWKTIPSSFLRNSNLTFSLTVVINFTLTLGQGLIMEKYSESIVSIAVISLVLIICGLLMTFDALKIRKQARELAEIHGCNQE